MGLGPATPRNPGWGAGPPSRFRSVAESAKASELASTHRVDFPGQWYRRLRQGGREVSGIFGRLLLDGISGLHVWGEICRV